MASLPLAELPPESQSWLWRNRAGQQTGHWPPAAGSSCSWGCNPYPGSWGVGQSPRHTHPGSAGCQGPTHSHLCIPTRGPVVASVHPLPPPTDQAKTRALSLATLPRLLQTMAPVAPPTRGGENLPQQAPQDPRLCVPAQPSPGQWPHGPHRVAVRLLRILGRRCPQEQQQQRPEQ